MNDEATHGSASESEGESVIMNELREREAQYRSIFEAASDSLVITDLQAVIVEANPAACTAYGYAHDEIIGLTGWDLIHPDDHGTVTQVLQQLVAEHPADTTEARTVPLRTVSLRKDGTSFVNEGYARRFTYRGEPHLMTVGRDITDRVVADERLRDTEAQYREIFSATTDAMFIADTEGYIVEVNPAACLMYNAEYDELLHSRAQILSLDDVETIERTGSFRQRTINTRRDGTSFHIEGTAKRVTYRGTPHLLVVARDVSDQVEAYELLERRVEERTRELRTLLDVSRSVASTLDLQPLLTLILDQLNLVVENDGSALLSLEGSDLIVLTRRAPSSDGHSFPDRYTVQGHAMMWEPLSRGEPVIIDDVRGDSPMARAYARLLGAYLKDAFSYERSFMAVPMMLKDRIVGLLSVSSSREGFYTAYHAELAHAIAQQAAIAIENARLYAQAQELAALEERQRLARELHDSVTQALFGINVAAHTARAQLQRDPDKARESIEYLRSLAQGGMAEMRALLFELRPESLQSEGLVVAIRKQTQALTARHEIPINLKLGEEPAAALPVKEALYRITQEALNNTFKHARPLSVAVTLAPVDGDLVLEVEDVGGGFDATAEYPGHLGLRTMAERAARLNGILEIDSAVGKGTRLRATIPLHPG